MSVINSNEKKLDIPVKGQIFTVNLCHAWPRNLEIWMLEFKFTWQFWSLVVKFRILVGTPGGGGLRYEMDGDARRLA